MKLNNLIYLLVFPCILIATSAMAEQIALEGKITCSPLRMGDYICTIDTPDGPLQIGESVVNEGDELGGKLVDAAWDDNNLKLWGEIKIGENGERYLSTEGLSFEAPVTTTSDIASTTEPQNLSFDETMVSIKYEGIATLADLNSALEQQVIMGTGGKFMIVTLSDLIDIFLEQGMPITLVHHKYADKDIASGLRAYIAFDAGTPGAKGVTMAFMQTFPGKWSQQLREIGVTPPSDDLEWLVFTDGTVVKENGRAWNMDILAYAELFKRELAKGADSRILELN